MSKRKRGRPSGDIRSEEMAIVHVMISSDLIVGLQELSRIEGRAKAVIVRQALRKYLADHEPQPLEFE